MQHAGTITGMRGHTDTVKGVAFFNDGGRVVTCSGDKTLRIWDVQNNDMRKSGNRNLTRIL